MLLPGECFCLPRFPLFWSEWSPIRQEPEAPYNNETRASETKCTEACRSNYPAKQGITRPPASLEDSKSRGIEDQKKVISPLYSADLIGGCLGSLLGSLILIPLAGMDVTTWGMLLLAVFSILLI